MKSGRHRKFTTEPNISNSPTVVAAAKREQSIVRMYLDGIKIQEIADKFNLTTASIWASISRSTRHWKERAAAEIAEHKALEIAKIDRLEAEYWDAWRSSKKPKTTTKQEARRSKGGELEPNKAVITETEYVGDPQFLAGVQWCIEERCKILGLFAKSNEPNVSVVNVYGEVLESTMQKIGRMIEDAEKELAEQEILDATSRLPQERALNPLPSPSGNGYLEDRTSRPPNSGNGSNHSAT